MLRITSVIPENGPAPLPVAIDWKCFATCSAEYGRLDIDKSIAVSRTMFGWPPAGSFSYNASAAWRVVALKTAGGLR
eukprot:1941141-Ditylum_brightwellii.AAC.1